MRLRTLGRARKTSIFGRQHHSEPKVTKILLSWSMLPGGAGVKPRGSSSQAERVADNRDFIQAVSTSIQGLAQLVSNFGIPLLPMVSPFYQHDLRQLTQSGSMWVTCMGQSPSRLASRRNERCMRVHRLAQQSCPISSQRTAIDEGWKSPHLWRLMKGQASLGKNISNHARSSFQIPSCLKRQVDSALFALAMAG